jgi:hypothetical protein
MDILGKLRLILESEEFLQDWEDGECRNILQTLFDPGENAYSTSSVLSQHFYGPRAQ